MLAACIGSFTYGYVISVLATTLSKPDFYIYMGLDTVGPGKGYANAIIAAWNCLLYVGAVFGGVLYSFVSDRWGRKTPIVIGASLTALGGALQAGTVNSAMLAVARVIIGLGIGFILPAIPLYQAEVAPPHARGLMVGLHGKLVFLSTTIWNFGLYFMLPRIRSRFREYGGTAHGSCFLQIRRPNLLESSFGNSMRPSFDSPLPYLYYARESQMA